MQQSSSGVSITFNAGQEVHDRNALQLQWRMQPARQLNLHLLASFVETRNARAHNNPE